MDGAATRLAFRFATADDVDTIVELVESAYRGDSSRAGWTTEADLLDGQRTDAGLVRADLARPGGHVLLVEADGELVGCCALTRPDGERDTKAGGQAGAAGANHAETDGAEPGQSKQSGAPEPHGCSPASASGGAAYLGMFAVRPGLQGGGIGRAILDEAARIARDDWGAATLELTTITQRTDLIAWYERRGFARTGELRPFPYGEPRYGLPRRDDLEQAVLARALR
jgi:ribosomal protein S18 acetylase RimI-like enzyme